MAVAARSTGSRRRSPHLLRTKVSSLVQPFLPPAGGNHAPAHFSHCGRVGVGVGERGLRERALEGDLAAQRVSGVGDEAPVRFARVTFERRRRPPPVAFTAIG